MKRGTLFLSIILAMMLVTPAYAQEHFTRVVGVNLPVSLALPPVSNQIPPVVNQTEDTKITADQAIQLLRREFPDLTQGIELQSRYSQGDFTGNMVWRIESHQEGRYLQSAENRISGSVDAVTGNIISFNFTPGSKYHKGLTPSVTREKAAQLAETFLQKRHVDQLDQLKLQSAVNSYSPWGYFSSAYSFVWMREKNGIQVDWNQVRISVDAYTGAIVQYQNTWSSQPLPEPHGILSKQEVVDRIISKAGVTLAYSRIPVRMAGATAVKPVYKLNLTAPFIDAKTGEFLNAEGQVVADQEAVIYKEQFKPQPEPVKPLQDLLKPVEPQQIEKTVKGFFKSFGYTGNIQYNGGGSESGAGYKREYNSYSLVDQQGNQLTDLTVNIDMHTGLICGFRREGTSGFYEGNLITAEQAVAKAREAVAEYSPDKVGHLTISYANQIVTDRQDRHFITFARLINGIPYEFDQISVIVDNAGDIVSYEEHWGAGREAPLLQVINPSQAKDMLGKHLNPALQYYSSRNNIMPNAADMRIVYRIPTLYVDAVSGKLIDIEAFYQGSNSLANSFTGHPAAASLSLLAENSLIPNQAKPDEAVDRMAVLRTLITVCKTPYQYDYDSLKLSIIDIPDNEEDQYVIKEAINKSIIANQGLFCPNDIITREDLCIWLVRALDYENVVLMKNRINLPFKDQELVPPDKINYVGLISGLGIMESDKDNNFRPLDKVTWAELAEAAARLSTMMRNDSRYW